MDENLIPATDRKVQRLVRALGRHLDRNELDAFENATRANCSSALLLAMRRQKTLMRAAVAERRRAANILVEAAQILRDGDEQAEFGRYVALSVEIAAARDSIKEQIRRVLRSMPKISLRQLLAVADKVAREFSIAPPDLAEAGAFAQRAAEHGRQIHEHSGRINDAWFAVARAINEAAGCIGPGDLKRADASVKAAASFRILTVLSSRLNSLDYALDNASFGEFRVTEHDREWRAFKLDIVDVHLTLIRVTAIRRNLLGVLGRRRPERYVRAKLAESCEPVLHNAVMRYLMRGANVPVPDGGDIEYFDHFLQTLLLMVDAEDDLLFGAAAEPEVASILYHLSLAIRLNAIVGETIANRLTRQHRRDFDDQIHRDDLVSELGSELQAAAFSAWPALTVELPVRSHFDLIRHPFIRTSAGTARAVPALVGDRWTITVRETLNQGGATGNRYGALWEDFYAQGFANSGWTVLARNVKIRSHGAYLAEIDMLLLREDLLLVVEVKALTGSGITPYDHWKNREIIERGCRQASRAARYIDTNRDYIASVADRSTASRITHVQPLVLTTETMFDGWVHAGVPVAGETVRKAITTGTKVEYYQGSDRKVMHTDWHLRPEDLTTQAILQDLRDPIELKLAPEKGYVRHIPVEAAGLRMLIPDTGFENDPPSA
jgi:Holliday junction resolvase-like predicted endonuclease